jgi:hypothetical protein
MTLSNVAAFVPLPPGPGLDNLLVRAAQTQAIFSLLLCLGAVL